MIFDRLIWTTPLDRYFRTTTMYYQAYWISDGLNDLLNAWEESMEKLL
jgi:hypothetical protein